MNRQDVYKLIDGERDYQDSLAHHSTEADANFSVADWVIFIEEHVLQAKNRVYYLEPEKALEQVRKIAALAVACMEHNDTNER